MFLAVNAGNTRVVLGVYHGEELRRVWRISSDPARTEDEYGLLMRQFFRDGGVEPTAVRGAMISSVVARLTATLKTALRDLLGIEPLVLTHELDLGFRICYRDPKDVGADRLANTAGGMQRYGAPLIIVDSGTATTFDVLSADRDYLGGIILPGMDMSADALFQKTSLLPRIAIEPPRSVIGNSTQAAIASGIVWGTVGAVDRLILQVRQEIGAPDCRAVATGGYAEVLTSLSSELSQADPDLTLFGIRKIWERNAPK